MHIFVKQTNTLLKLYQTDVAIYYIKCKQTNVFVTWPHFRKADDTHSRNRRRFSAPNGAENWRRLLDCASYRSCHCFHFVCIVWWLYCLLSIFASSMLIFCADFSAPISGVRVLSLKTDHRRQVSTDANLSHRYGTHGLYLYSQKSALVKPLTDMLSYRSPTKSNHWLDHGLDSRLEPLDSSALGRRRGGPAPSYLVTPGAGL